MSLAISFLFFFSLPNHKKEGFESDESDESDEEDVPEPNPQPEKKRISSGAELKNAVKSSTTISPKSDTVSPKSESDAEDVIKSSSSSSNSLKMIHDQTEELIKTQQKIIDNVEQLKPFVTKMTKFNERLGQMS
jgi:hypothetical protein